MSYQNILDRVPQEVLPNGAVRYGIYDASGNLTRYEYIKREDEPIEEGTPINRGLLSNIQGDLYTQDRYNSVKEVKDYDFHMGKWVKKAIVNSANTLQSICYAKGKYIVGGPSGNVYISENKETWQTVATGLTGNIIKIIYSEEFDLFLTSGSGLATSKDLQTWTVISGLATSNGNYYNLVSAKGKILAIDNNGYLNITTDGVNWQYKKRIGETFYGICGLSFWENKFMLTSYNDLIYGVSEDGENWEFIDLKGKVDTNNKRLLGICAKGNNITVFGDDIYLISEDNGDNWQLKNHYKGTLEAGNSVEYLDNKFIRIYASASEPGCFISSDCKNWSYIYWKGVGAYCYDIIFDGDSFATCAASGTMFYTLPYSNYFKLDLPLSSYNEGKVVKIKCEKEIEEKEEEFKLSNSESIIPVIRNSNYSSNYESKYGYWKYSGPTNGYAIFDGQKQTAYTTTLGTTYSATSYVYLPPETYIKPSKFHVTQETGSRVDMSISGRLPNTDTWEEITTETISSSGIVISVSPDKFYSGFRFQFKRYSDSYTTATIKQITLYEGTIRYSNQYEFEKPLLDINSLGLRTIDGTIKYGREYVLVDKGTQWDINYNKEELISQLGTEYITGTYTGNSTTAGGTQSIDLPFVPKLIIVANPEKGYVMFASQSDFVVGTNAGDGSSSSSSVPEYFGTYGKISYTVGFKSFTVSNGTGTVSASLGYNYSGVTYRYWAFR